MRGPVIGGLVGHFSPDAGVRLKPLGDGFIALMKMLIGPIIFLSVVIGIAGVPDVLMARIHLTMAAIFVAQTLNVELTLPREIALLAVAMLTSKDALGVTGAGFITLTATLAVVPTVPVAGLALILGIDRFMSEARALTNLIGNGVATIVVSHREGELDRDTFHAQLDAGPDVATPASEP